MVDDILQTVVVEMTFLAMWMGLPRSGLKCQARSFSFVELPFLGVLALTCSTPWWLLVALPYKLAQCIHKEKVHLLEVCDFALMVCYYSSLLHNCMTLLQCVFLKNPLGTHDWYLPFDGTDGKLYIASVRKPNPCSWRQNGKLLTHVVGKVQC